MVPLAAGRKWLAEAVCRTYRAKRVLDITVLAIVAIPALVVGVVCAVAVLATSRGPILFKQERVGRFGRPFTVLKFRTMTVGDNPIFPDETRITRSGRWLRRFSLDELPQLINVARGDMSIVGPRPTLAYQVDRYSNRQRLRLAVRPGLTGLAQVNGRNTLNWSDRIEYDIEYVQRQSLWLDLTILVKTAKAVVSGDGAEGHPSDDPMAILDADDPEFAESAVAEPAINRLGGDVK